MTSTLMHDTRDSFGVFHRHDELDTAHHEAAILAFGAVREMPWVVEGQLAVRQITQLALSFDHRLVDGELGSQVLVEVGRLLHDPAEAFLYV